MNNKEFIMQMRPLFGEAEKKELLNYLDEDGFMTEFKRTERFEELIAQFTGAKHCIVVNNGTISLTLAALASGINAGDEVLVPNYTMIATPNSIKMIGAKPVFVDVEDETLVMDINLARKAITDRTRAIILVTANGRAPRAGVEKFKELCEEHDLILIEDSAQSMGSYYPNGLHIGRVGLIGSFSFSAPKIISTGQGGALITDDDTIAHRLRRLKDFGRAEGGTDIHDTIGYNFKFTELQACLGIAQMGQLSERLIRKKQIWQKYKDGLDKISGIKLFNHDIGLCTPWFIDATAHKRDDLCKYLKDRGIGTRLMYPPINQQIAYKIKGDFPVSENIGRTGIWLPSMIQLTDDQIERICLEIENFYNE